MEFLLQSEASLLIKKVRILLVRCCAASCLIALAIQHYHKHNQRRVLLAVAHVELSSRRGDSGI